MSDGSGRRRSPREIFGAARPVVGMIHLLPLPGSPGWGRSIDAVLERAAGDARTLAAAGVDGLLVENFLDAPFHPRTVPPETVAAMAVAVRSVREAASLPVGVNVLRNDARAALAVAAAAEAGFIRVNVHTGAMFTDQGMLEGRAHETLRARAALVPGAAILADVLVKHATPPPGVTLEEAARDAWERGRADVLVVSGRATGETTDPDRVRRTKEAVPDAPVWVGSGADPRGGAEALRHADGVILGSALQRDGVAGRGADPGRAAEVVPAVRSALGSG